ncbi:hypothetical protein [Sediminibacterium sp.]|uniref:hypothetical protein n=1 Tax=Sediminibacterium sp. TaxID=1917865 RepID=UPI0025D1E772|nr:hypothetical protein [Sediminibacterium sp.]MBT9485318.1 hypothetical protein [Sediminibacterium sp.]
MKKIFLQLTLILIIINSACNKSTQDIEINTKNKSEITKIDFRFEITMWLKSLNENKLVDTKTKETYSTVANLLDYSNASLVKGLGDENEIIIKLVKNETNSFNYIKLKKQNTKSYVAEFYKTEISLKSMIHFILTKNLNIGEKIEKWDINNKPIIGWEKTKSGKSVVKKLLKKIKKQNKPQNQLTNSSDLSIIEPKRVVDPEENECIEWYWIVYDEDTNEILYEEYIFSTGNCGGNGNSQTTSLNQSTCNYSEEEADDILSSFQEIYVNEVVDGIPGALTILNDGKIEEAITKTWKFGSAKFGFNSFYVRYNGIAHYSGVRFKLNSNDSKWKFKSFNFSSVSIEEEENLQCISVELNEKAHSEVIHSGDQGKCSVSIQAEFKASMSCVFGYRFGSPILVTNNTDLNAHN